MDNRIVDKKIDILKSLISNSSLDIVGWKARTADNPAPEEYVFDGDWVDVELPAYFPAGKTVFLKSRAVVLDEAPIVDTYISFQIDHLEGLLRIDGVPYCGIDMNHLRVQVPRTGALELELEFNSNPEALYHPALAVIPGQFKAAVVCEANRNVEGLIFDLQFAIETSRTISDPRRKKLLAEAVEAALLAVDLTLPRVKLLEEVENARGIIADRLSAIAPDPEAGTMYAVGHSHIDTAWLWQVKETVRKCGRTFSTACRLMEQFPDFHFACSQPQLYQYAKDYYPEVYAQIKTWVAEGRWETTGAMWVEADCNVTSGESLIRQMLHGIAFFKAEFGTRPRNCWLPDVFGYPSSLPEILAGCGITSFYTFKLHWQTTNPFPDHLFYWRGLDGTDILAAVINAEGAYNGFPTPRQLHIGWERYAQKAEYPEVIFPYGHGDGGGGVTEWMLEFMKRAQRPYPGLPAVKTGPSEGFFDDVVKRKPQLPVWDGELYVETHRGTYTTQSALKKANRISELLLREAEIWNAISRKGDQDALRSAWKLVLLNQFHDILPGSSIPQVYVDALRDHESVHNTAKRQIENAQAALTPAVNNSTAIRLFNSLSWARCDAARIKIPSAMGSVALVDSDGTEHLTQIVAHESDGDIAIVEGAEIPSLGYADFNIVAKPSDVISTVCVTPEAIETPLFRMEINSDGAITSLFDKTHCREVISANMPGNDLQLLQDGPEGEDAWNIHDTSDKRRYPFDGETTVSVVESGPVRGIVRVTRHFRESTFEQDIVVTAGSKRIDFVTRVDWQARQTMLKVAFPLAIRSTHATYEVQFGALERPSHRNTSWDKQKFEVPAQRWADISESGYGVSLLNDSRYGYDAKENVLRMTLLRSTTFPDPHADQGKHEFTYSLFPHAGGWVEGETVRRGWELNVPTRSLPVNTVEPPHSFVSITGADAILEALKPAEDGRGLILRMYEPHGARGEVVVKTSMPLANVLECNLVEEDGGRISATGSELRFDILPFQIRTFRLNG